ncbi:hypothetical protein FN976_11060 [Caenimonas sedimenti]|uniref:Uncharacterized protein n=1 Tax=Caenimonas sedimenti TaxID=2596921 RepID=A0A562ZSR4_9BURK|nr:hypothetical protein [Caenimonas sedimenti]TWO71447.1 hypothetical protein FN976_11060 [Caenimonas sedimenti]
MRRLAAIVLLTCFAMASWAEMVPGDRVGNDLEKEKLCLSRAKGKAAAFEIDSKYVAAARARHPDVTFVAIDGMSPQLVECYLREGTGRYEPASSSPAQAFWRLQNSPKSSAINTPKGNADAAKVCLTAAPVKINREGFDHAVYSSVVEIASGSPKYRPGLVIGGRKAELYDIAVGGAAFYKATGPDLKAVNFTCLLSPSLDVLAIQLN